MGSSKGPTIYPPDKVTDLMRDYAEFVRVMLANFGAVIQERDSAQARFSADCLARGISQSISITFLYERDNFPDAYILYRSLLDRLLLFMFLVDEDEFEVFDDYSFWRRYQYWSATKSRPEAKGRVDPSRLWLAREAKERIKRVSKDERITKWRRPNAEEVAKKHKVSIIYHFGYDYASQWVHPLMEDGVYTYRRLMKMTTDDLGSDNGLLLYNSFLVFHLLVSECVLAALQLGLAWRQTVHDTQEAFYQAVTDGSYSGYQAALLQFLNIAQEAPLFEFQT